MAGIHCNESARRNWQGLRRMSGKATGALRTGRASLVRAYLRRQRSPKSAREIIDAVEPGGNISLMTATLSTLHGGGHVIREGSVQGNIRWKIAAISPAARKSIATSAGSKTPARKQVREPKTKQVREPKTKPALTTAATTRSKTIVQPTPAPSREQKTNFSAPLSTVASVKRIRSTHETVDAFMKRGGRIEVLPLGSSSQPLQHIHDQRQQQRAKGRATQRRIRANDGA